MTDDDVERVARAICRVLLNGGDPDQPAARWNGTEIELQSFPAWRDYRDEARAAIAALEAADWRKIGPDEVVLPREPTAEMLDAGIKARTVGWGTDRLKNAYMAMTNAYRAMIAAKDE